MIILIFDKTYLKPKIVMSDKKNNFIFTFIIEIIHNEDIIFLIMYAPSFIKDVLLDLKSQINQTK